MNVEYCCLDASAFSLGFAASHGNTLILGKSENVLSDLVDPMKPCRLTEPRTEEGRAFAEYLRKVGCVSENGILDTPSLAPAAAEYALDMHLDVLLGVKIISCDNGHIRIYTNSGIRDVSCKKTVRRPEVKTDIKRLNCLVSGTDRDMLSAFERFGGRTDDSFEKDEYILSLPFPPACRLNEARIEFVNKFRACFGTSVQIDAFAVDFEYGSSFTGIMEEFEAGVAL